MKKQFYILLKKIEGQISQEVDNGKISLINIENILNDNNEAIFEFLEDEQIKTEFEFYHKLRQFPCTNLGLISLIQSIDLSEDDKIITIEMLRNNILSERSYIDKTIEKYKFFN